MADPTCSAASSALGPHTSIVYFHGMGTPRRYEELSRVLDSLDRYAEGLDDDYNMGRLRRQEMDRESSRVGGDEPVAFLRFVRQVLVPPTESDKKPWPRPIAEYRLYESYWSPAAAGGMSPVRVLLWMLARAFTPFKVWRRSWRAHQRFRLTFLNRMAYDRKSIPAKIYARLGALYRRFENLDERRAYPRGSMKQFKAFIQDRTDLGARERQDLLDLTDAWRREIDGSQIQVLLMGATLFAFLFGTFSLAVGAVIRIANVAGAPIDAFQTLAESARVLPNPAYWIAGLLLPLALLYGGRFFRDFLSDVVFWTTTYEKNTRYQTRKDILRNCEATLRHVLSHPRCNRVVIVAHSLGTAIAYETLLNLGRRASAEMNDTPPAGPPPRPVGSLLGKLSHVITFGSPIDRIAYFFNLAFSRYHRFNRVTETLAGQTSDLPFKDGHSRVIQWWNIRDAADPVASRLFSARGRLPNRADINEIEVSNSHIPNPAGAHTGYFDATLSGKLLFDACILDRRQIQLQEPRSRLSKGFALWGRRFAWSMALVAVWALAIGGAGFWSGSHDLTRSCQWVFAVALCAILAIGGVGAVLDRKERLTLPT